VASPSGRWRGRFEEHRQLLGEETKRKTVVVLLVGLPEALVKKQGPKSSGAIGPPLRANQVVAIHADSHGSGRGFGRRPIPIGGAQTANGAIARRKLEDHDVRAELLDGGRDVEAPRCDASIPGSRKDLVEKIPPFSHRSQHMSP